MRKRCSAILPLDARLHRQRFDRAAVRFFQREGNDVDRVALKIAIGVHEADVREARLRAVARIGRGG